MLTWGYIFRKPVWGGALAFQGSDWGKLRIWWKMHKFCPFSPLNYAIFTKWQIYENLPKIEIYIHDGKLGCNFIDVCIFQICIEIKYNLPDSVLLCVQQSNLFSIVILQGPDFTWKRGLRIKQIINCTFTHSFTAWVNNFSLKILQTQSIILIHLTYFWKLTWKSFSESPFRMTCWTWRLEMRC